MKSKLRLKFNLFLYFDFYKIINKNNLKINFIYKIKYFV